MPVEQSKPLKKEEVESEDEDDKPIGYLSDRKNNTTPNNAALPKTSKVKKELTKIKKEDSDDEFDNKPINTKMSNKPNKVQVKKEVKKEVKKTVKEEVTKKKRGKEAGLATVKKEKKVYDLPGQKRDPPEERDPLRIFYESLYEQKPGSDMAAIWMMESGLLPMDKAIKVLEKKQKKAQQQKLGSPMKSVVTVKKKGDSVTVKRKTSSTPASIQKKEKPQTKKTPPSKVASQQSKKRKIEESSEEDSSSEEEEEDSDNEVIANPKNRKMQRAN